MSNLKEPLLPNDTDQLDNSLLNNDELSIHSPNHSNSTNNNDHKDIHFRCCCSEPTTTYRMNHNVFVTLLNDFFYGTAESLWGGTVLVAYLKRLGHDQNGPVGWIEAISGVTMLLTALPVGYLADKYGRSIVIRCGGVLFLLTVLLQATVVMDDGDELSFVWWGIVMGLWGIGTGIVHGPCEALYADSTPAGQRSQYYLYLMIVYSLASCIGPIVSIVLFQTVGDDWDLAHLRTIIYVGLGLEVVSSIIMMFYDDRKALPEKEEEDDDEDDEHNNGDNRDAENVISNASGEEPITTPLLSEETTTTTQSFQKRYQFLIPYILFVSSFIMSIGSGMTVKFFPLFFKDTVGLSPTHVQMIYVLVPIVMASCSGVATFLAKKYGGRVPVTILLECAGVSCLYAMVMFQNYLDRHPWLLVPVYVVRTALMNCPYPLQESILMDFVAKEKRARWKSLESIAAFGWCGSAALGGYVADRWSYSTTFFLTAIIQSLGILVFALLLPLVPRQEAAASG